MEMKYTISEMENDLVLTENKKEVRYKGYALIDQYGNCHIIVYGESRKKSLMEYFNIKKENE